MILRTVPGEASIPLRAGSARVRRQPQACPGPSENRAVTAVGSSLRRAVEGLGRFRRAQWPGPDASARRHPGPDGVVAFFAVDAAVSRARPGLRGRTRAAAVLLRGPVLHAGFPGLCFQAPDPGVFFGGGAISAGAGVFSPPLRDPAPRPSAPRARTIWRPHPNRPGLPNDPWNDSSGELRTVFRCRHDPIPAPRPLRPLPEKHQTLHFT